MLRCLFFILCFLNLEISAQVKNAMASPNGAITANFWLDENGVAMYEIAYKGKLVLEPSVLGLQLAYTEGGKPIENSDKNFVLGSIKKKNINTSWKTVWGQETEIKDHHNLYTISLQQEKLQKPIQINIHFRLYNDGVAFRYEFPQQNNLGYFIVKDEKTSFNLRGDAKAFWIPGDYDTNEYSPNVTNLSEINPQDPKFADEIHAKSPIAGTAVQTPLQLKTIDNIYVNIHEAALLNYSAMNLELDKATFNLKCHLVPDALGNKAYVNTPFNTPWRTIIISDKATDILDSRIILNCNEPSKIKDVSWIKPTKYIGLWWEMHVGKSTWDYAGSQDMNSWENLKNLKPSGKHGATTKRVKQYIDFASKHGFDAVLVEGWNVGWEDWFGRFKEDVFDFVTPYPDFDVAELSRYAKLKKVKIIMHHETSGSATNYDRQMDTAYRFMKKFGYDAVKSGYVGKIIPRGEHHDGQWMVKHFERSFKKTADYKIMIDAHEPVRPTGLHRTYPNFMASEAARGMEFNAWSKGNLPRHESILAFTRFLGGPMDYTPGIFKLDLSYWDKTKTETIHTTLAKQLALYVVIHSPLQMAADLPEIYEQKLDAFQFIKDVEVDWLKSIYLEAEPGEFLTVARKGKKTGKWFIGAITNENARSTIVDLSFLDAGKTYTATIYADAPDSDYNNKETAEKYIISKKKVTAGDKLKLNLAPGGGCAIEIK